MSAMWLTVPNVPRLANGTVLYRIECDFSCWCQLATLSFLVGVALKLVRPFSQCQSSLALGAHIFIILWLNRPSFRIGIDRRRHGVAVVVVVRLFRYVCGVALPNMSLIVIVSSMEFNFDILRSL